MQMKPTVRVTETIYGEDSRKGLLEGVKTLHDPVASTLGASGRTVIIEDIYGNPQPTKDGVTVAKNIVPLDSVERMGCEIIKQASLRTAEEAGDGTTTSTILAKAIIDGGFEAMRDKSVNYTDFNKGMFDAVDCIDDFLEDVSQPVTLDNVESVAIISANNDNELGRVISEAFAAAGEHGVVLMEKSETAATFHTLTEGFELEKGYLSDAFVTDKGTNKAEYRDALVLISNVKIERISQIEPFAEYAITNGHRALVVVAEFEDVVLSTLAMNKMKGNIKVLCVSPSHFGVRRKDILNDLAVSTGAILIDEDTGDNFDEFFLPPDEGQARWTMLEKIGDTLGECHKVSSDKHKTVFFNDISEQTQVHIKNLKKQSNKAKGAEKNFLEERIAKISSSVAVIHVGAASSTEQSEKADRVDDAIHAVRAALQEGIVAGGGVALYNASLYLQLNAGDAGNKAYEEGFMTVLHACIQPLIVVLGNADITFESVIDKFEKDGYGIDVKSGKTGSMIEMKIIDPLKVTKSALKNAVSAASTLLSTSTTIVNLRRADV